MTTPEEARQKEINGCNQIINAGYIAQRYIGQEGRKLAQANKRFWQEADTATVTKMAEYIDSEYKSSIRNEESDNILTISAIEKEIQELQEELKRLYTNLPQKT